MRRSPGRIGQAAEHLDHADEPQEPARQHHRPRHLVERQDQFSRHRQTERGPRAAPERSTVHRSRSVPPWRIAAVFPHGGGILSVIWAPPSQGWEQSPTTFALVARDATPRHRSSGRRSPNSSWFDLVPHPSRPAMAPRPEKVRPPSDRVGKRSIRRFVGQICSQAKNLTNALRCCVTWSRIVPRSIG